MIATVKYQVAQYKGKIVVYAEPNEPDENIIAKAKRKVKQQTNGVPFPFGYQKWEVIDSAQV